MEGRSEDNIVVRLAPAGPGLERPRAALFGERRDLEAESNKKKSLISLSSLFHMGTREGKTGAELKFVDARWCLGALWLQIVPRSARRSGSCRP